MNLSVVLATRNEEDNIARCLNSVKKIADEVVIFDEHSTDNTVKIAKEFGARVYDTNHEEIFHITKQKAIEKAKGEWVLQLDADEEVSPQLASEIVSIMQMSNEEIAKRKPTNRAHGRLFMRHLKLLEQREGGLGHKTGELVAFFIPRINMFIGKPLIHGGVYPDGVIRFFKNGKARLPAKSVHEQMVIDGEVGWLFEPLYHFDSPTLKRYIERLNRYTDLHADELRHQRTPKNLKYILLASTFWPLKAFVRRYFLTAGFKDGLRGFIWAVFSAWHYPLAYYKYFSRSETT